MSDPAATLSYATPAPATRGSSARYALFFSLFVLLHSGCQLMALGAAVLTWWDETPKWVGAVIFFPGYLPWTLPAPIRPSYDHLEYLWLPMVLGNAVFWALLLDAARRRLRRRRFARTMGVESPET